jgi:hypothetical protein
LDIDSAEKAFGFEPHAEKDVILAQSHIDMEVQRLRFRKDGQYDSIQMVQKQSMVVQRETVDSANVTGKNSQIAPKSEKGALIILYYSLSCSKEWNLN